MMNTMIKPSVAMASSTSNGRLREIEMPARNAPFSIDQQPDEQRQRFAPHGERERAEQQAGDADRHIRAAKFRCDGVQQWLGQESRPESPAPKR